MSSKRYQHLVNRDDVCLGLKAFYAEPSRPPPHSQQKLRHISPASHIFGHFQFLKSLDHKNMCQYIDIVKGKQEDRLYIISEHYTQNLQQKLVDNPGGVPETTVSQWVLSILDALMYLNRNNIVLRNLSLNNLLLDGEGKIKLADVGLHYATAEGSLVPFPIGDPHYLAPESLASGVEWREPHRSELSKCTSTSPKVDTWSLGIIMIELLSGKSPWKYSDDPFDIMLQVLEFAGHEIDFTSEKQKFMKNLEKNTKILHERESGRGPNGSYTNGISSTKPNSDPKVRSQIYNIIKERQIKNLQTWFSELFSQKISEDMKEIISLCLTTDPHERPEPEELASHPYFRDLANKKKKTSIWVTKPFVKSNCINIEGDQFKLDKEGANFINTTPNEVTHDLSISELFQFWQLSGGDLEDWLPDHMKMPPAIRRLPTIVRIDAYDQYKSQQFLARDSSRSYNPQIISIQMSQIIQQLETPPTLVEQQQSQGKISQDLKSRSVDRNEGDPRIPVRRLSARETNYSYQRSRIITFKKLLDS